MTPKLSAFEIMGNVVTTNKKLSECVIGFSVVS